MSNELEINLEDIYNKSIEQNIDFFECFQNEIDNYPIQNQLEIFDSVGYEFFKGLDYENAIAFWTIGKESANSNNMYKYEISFLRDIGTAYMEVGESSKGIEFLKEAILLAKNHDIDENLIDILFGLSQAYIQIDDKEKSLEYSNLALEEAKNINTYYEISRAYLSLGNCYTTMLDYKIAKDSYEKALTHAIDGELDENLVATIEMNIGNIYKNTLDLLKALEYYEKVEKLYLKTKFEEIYTLYINMGIVYTKLHRFDEAQEYLNVSLEFYKKLEKHDDIATCLINLGRLEEEIGDSKKAKEYHLEALELSKKYNDLSYLKTTNFLNIANCCYGNDELEEALFYYRECLKNAKIFKQVDMLASALKGIADVYGKKGRYESAIKIYFKSIEYAKSCNDVEVIIASYINLASLYTEIGELENALKIYEDTLEESKKYSHTKYEISTMINIASLYITFKDIDKSYNYLYDALDKVIEFEDKELESKIYSNLANLFEITEQYNESINFTKKAIKIKKELNKTSSLALSYGALARAYEELDDTGEAKYYYEKAMELFKKVDDLKNYNIALVNYGFFLYRFEIDMQKSLELNQEALRYFTKYNMRDALVVLYSNLGTIYQLRDVKKSKDYLTRAIDTHRDIDVPLHDENWNINFRQEIGQIYEKLIEINIKEKTFIDAFNIIEDAKSNTFLKKLSKQDINTDAKYNLIKECL